MIHLFPDLSSCVSGIFELTSVFGKVSKLIEFLNPLICFQCGFPWFSELIDFQQLFNSDSILRFDSSGDLETDRFSTAF